MNIFNKVTLKSLLKNKVRTIVTIIGIMLSAAMICAVTTFVSSIYNYALQNALYTYGDWHGSTLDTTEEKFKEISASEKLEDYVYANQLGYADINSENENKPYLYILGTSSNFNEMMPVNITQGRYPENTTEILLPDHLFENGGVSYSLNDTLTLQIGIRESDGFKLWQNNPFYVYDSEGNTVPAGEELVIKESRSYTVVGFYERPSFEEYTAPGYTALTTIDSAPTKDTLYSLWFKMDNAKDVYSFMEDMNISGNRNTSVLTYSGVTRYDNLNNMITGLAIIVIGLIMFGSISLIYNAFSISVSERTKQFGLLSSIGATKKQLRKMVFFEAAAVSIIGIPLGIVVGISGIGITLLFIGNKFKSIIGYAIPLRLSVSPLSIVMAVAVALITVFISAFIPSKRATKVSAVEAIRLNQDIKVKSNTLKTSKLTYKLFGLSGMLAVKHYKRNRKKYRTTVISLFMSIVLFVSASAFTDYLMESVAHTFSSHGYDISYINNNDAYNTSDREELLKEFSDDAAVTGTAYSQSRSLFADIDPFYISGEEVYDNSFATIKTDEAGNKICSVHISLNFVDDASFDRLLTEYDLKTDDFKNKNSPKAIVVDGNSYFDKEEEKYKNINILKNDKCYVEVPIIAERDEYHYYGVIEKDGVSYYRYYKGNDTTDYIDLTPEEAYTIVPLTAGKVIYNRPFYIQATQGLVFIYPDSLKEEVLMETPVTNYSYMYFFTSGNHKESYKAIERTLADLNIKGGSLINYAEYVEENRNIVIIIQVFAYGFIILISLIAAANVFNTISTNIHLRRREFAMLKSVGMTEKGFNRMMNFECILYGSRALLWGLPVSVIVTYSIYLTVQEGYSTGFRLPWASIGIAFLSVFVVVFATMMYSMRKIKKDNPIDALKNENL